MSERILTPSGTMHESCLAERIRLEQELAAAEAAAEEARNQLGVQAADFRRRIDKQQAAAEEARRGWKAENEMHERHHADLAEARQELGARDELKDALLRAKTSRIRELEAALREIAEGPRKVGTFEAAKIARAALQPTTDHEDHMNAHIHEDGSIQHHDHE